MKVFSYSFLAVSVEWMDVLWPPGTSSRRTERERHMCPSSLSWGEVNMAALLSAFISGQLVPIFKGSPSEAWDSSDPRFPFTSGLLVANFLFPS